METDTQKQEEAEHQHLDVETTLSLVRKSLTPLSSFTVIGQGKGTGMSCLPLTE